MSDFEEKDKRRKKFNRNVVAKYMFENKGAFAIKTINPRKTEYKRKRINIRDINKVEDLDG